MFCKSVRYGAGLLLARCLQGFGKTARLSWRAWVALAARWMYNGEAWLVTATAMEFWQILPEAFLSCSHLYWNRIYPRCTHKQLTLARSHTLHDGFASHCQVPYVVLFKFGHCCMNLFAGNSRNFQILYSRMCLGQKPVQLIVAYTEYP